MSYNDSDYRPLGPQTSHSVAGGNKECTFDIQAFQQEYPTALHTIPPDEATDRYGGHSNTYERSRLWTCEVREWSRWQSRATREANKAAAEGVASGDISGEMPGNRLTSGSRDKLFEKVLRDDPVYQEIMGETRGKRGPGP